MKKILKKLLKIESKIEVKQAELTETNKSLYYSIHNLESERIRDILEIQNELKDLLSLKFATLETLQIKINFIKPEISKSQRELSLIVNK